MGIQVIFRSQPNCCSWSFIWHRCIYSI